MFPNQEWAEPTPSFKGKVPIPVSDPNAAPLHTVSINCAWLPYIRGALAQLVLQTTWDAVEPALTKTQMQAMTLISMFDECVGETPVFACNYNLGDLGDGTRWFPHAYFALSTPPFANYVPTQGWGFVDGNFTSGGHVNWWRYACISLLFPSLWTFGTISMNYELLSFGENDMGLLAANFDTIRIWKAGVLQDTFQVGAMAVPTGSGTIAHDFAGVVGDEVRLEMVCSVRLDAEPAAGGFVITNCLLTGHNHGEECP